MNKQRVTAKRKNWLSRAADALTKCKARIHEEYDLLYSNPRYAIECLGGLAICGTLVSISIGLIFSSLTPSRFETLKKDLHRAAIEQRDLLTKGNVIILDGNKRHPISIIYTQETTLSDGSKLCEIAGERKDAVTIIKTRGPCPK